MQKKSQKKFGRCMSICLLFLCGMLSGAFKQPSSPTTAEELFAAVQKKYTEGASLRIKFRMEEEQLQGALALKRGNKYILELGNGRTIICNGKTVWNYDAVQKKVVVSSFHDNPDNISPERIFLNFPRGYTPTLSNGNTRNEAVLTLLPAKVRDQVGDMQRVTLRLTREPLTLTSIGIFDGSAQHDWTISSIKPDAGLTDAAFEWKPPQEAHIIDLRD
jgi:outer membrane lipoprotein-sorting protein